MAAQKGWIGAVAPHSEPRGGTRAEASGSRSRARILESSSPPPPPPVQQAPPAVRPPPPQSFWGTTEPKVAPAAAGAKGKKREHGAALKHFASLSEQRDKVLGGFQLEEEDEIELDEEEDTENEGEPKKKKYESVAAATKRKKAEAMGTLSFTVWVSSQS